MEIVDKAYLDEILNEGSNETTSNKEQVQTEDLEKVYEEIKQMAKNIGRGDRDHDMNVIMKFLEVRLLLM